MSERVAPRPNDERPLGELLQQDLYNAVDSLRVRANQDALATGDRIEASIVSSQARAIQQDLETVTDRWFAVSELLADTLGEWDDLDEAERRERVSEALQIVGVD